MRVVKPNQVGVLSRPFDHNNKYRFCVTGLILFPFAEPRYPMSESSLWLLVGKELRETAIDESMPKQNGEILLRADAYAPQGKPHRVVRAAMELDGKLMKEIAVVGDRVWKNGVPTEPEPFTVKSLRWEDAFGGEGFKPNPIGKGYKPREGSPLPNIEDPKHLITSMRQTPEPAGVGTYDITWPQRMDKAGTYDKEWLDHYYPGLARNIDWGFFNVAPRDQQIQGFFRGDEEIVLRNLHPEKPELRCKLPGVKLRCFLRRTRRSGEEVQTELAMNLDTLWLFPGAAHGVLVFHGVAPVREDDAADVSLLCLACEDLGRPKPMDHYERVLEQRLSKEHGALASLDDRPLMPDLRGDMKRPPSPYDEMADLVAHEQLAYKNMMKRGDRQVESARALLIAHGLDPDEHGPVPEDPIDTTAPLDEVLARAKNIEEELLERRRLAEESMASTEAELAQICAAHGIDFDEIKKEWRGPWKGGPPRPAAEEHIARMRQLAADSRAAGFDAREIDEYLADPSFVEMMHEQDRAQLEAYRIGAQDRSEPDLRSAEDSLRLREELLAAHARGESLAGRDLTGADLSGIELPGANLEEALLERCDLSRANLAGANLRRAVLVRAALSDARLDGANLEGANLSKAVCERTSLSGCCAVDAQLIDARLSQVNLDGANLERATLNETTLDRCSFRQVRAEGLLLDDLDLTGASFAGAHLVDAVFMKCGLDRADFSGADLAGATLFKCRGRNAIFAGIHGRSLRVVEGTFLEDCDFRAAQLEEACLRGISLVGCDFTGAHAKLSDFSECDLQDARFYRARARQSRFIRADLRRANLVGADLLDALLSKANVAGADLSGSNLYQADLSLVQGYREAKLTDAITARMRTQPLYADKIQDLD
ncbi:hypothetical protein BE21_18275 [Sorangium cellulosum]|uniref:DUF2169 domain-containing protein n=1 Tax=Sorangium cellulosum TaxID=56 RepID=A0A150TXP4_SORCE|nr:hypothetical protein BE21_18275 [Sorangium cellulosum]